MQVDDKKSKHVEIIEAKKRLEEVVKKQKNSDFNIQELNIYQQKNDLFKIMSNRIRILQSKKLERKFRHKDQQILINPREYLNFSEADDTMVK